MDQGDFFVITIMINDIYIYNEIYIIYLYIIQPKCVYLIEKLVNI